MAQYASVHRCHDFGQSYISLEPLVKGKFVPEPFSLPLTLLAEKLSLHSPSQIHPLVPIFGMNSPRAQRVQRRSVIARDILSSFDRHTLPIDYLPRIFDNIDHARSDHVSHPDFWTRQEELEPSLLQHAAHSDDFLNALTRLQRPENLIRLFREKLRRRFKSIIHRYDELAVRMRHRRITLNTPLGPHSSDLELRSEKIVAHHFADIGRELCHVSRAAEDYLEESSSPSNRAFLEQQLAPVLLEALDDVCARDRDVMHERGSAPKPAGVNLFDLIFSNQAHHGADFVIDPLESLSRGTLRTMSEKLASTRGTLIGKRAPQEYTDRLAHLQ